MRQDAEEQKIEGALNQIAWSTHGYRVEATISPLGKQVVNSGVPHLRFPG